MLPAPPPGMPFIPVEFAGLTVTPYVNQAGRLAYSLKAAEVRPVRRPGRAPAGRYRHRGLSTEQRDSHSCGPGLSGEQNW